MSFADRVNCEGVGGLDCDVDDECVGVGDADFGECKMDEGSGAGGGAGNEVLHDFGDWVTDDGGVGISGKCFVVTEVWGGVGGGVKSC